ncbi:Uma2 family endonuclease [Streptomyces sp. NPDC093252]|uniref:Uma2 family endonuclease n=1 Tax=Streptomyces sp. NPDC093252 TaxID=3154980 RepID=UPI00343856A4
MKLQEPADLLLAFEEASAAPIQPEYLDGMTVVPPPPDHAHSHTVGELTFQMHTAGFPLVGRGNGYRVTEKDGTTLGLLIPDFYLRRRKPSDADESYHVAHGGWYPIDMVALVGEVTSAHHEIDTGPKFRVYAAAGVPVYVLINRTSRTAHCHTDPVLPDDDPTRAYYATGTEVPLGTPLPLPAPLPPLHTPLPPPRPAGPRPRR